MTTVEDSVDIVVVSDNTRESLGIALAMLIAEVFNRDFRFHIAVPEDTVLDNELAAEIIQSRGGRVFRIASPTMLVEGRKYRIQNKIEAMRTADIVGPSLLMDSDMFAIRKLVGAFIFRDVPTAVPAHATGKSYPWDEIYAAFELSRPRLQVLSGANTFGPPWFNAGFVASKDGGNFAQIWSDVSRRIAAMDRVPQKWPYLDQIALPVAMALASAERGLSYDNVLPGRLNQNIFYWMNDATHVRSGVVVHHHYRVKLLRELFGKMLSNIDNNHGLIGKVLDGLNRFDDAEIDQANR